MKNQVNFEFVMPTVICYKLLLAVTHMNKIKPVGKIPWIRKQQPTPVFLPEESHGQRSLVGCNPWCHKELDTTEH